MEMRRAKLGFSKDTWGLLIADGFTGNFATSSNEDSRRRLWSEEAKVVLPLRPPGGWSAAGQPCDAWHFQFRKLANLYIDKLLGEVWDSIYGFGAEFISNRRYSNDLQGSKEGNRFAHGDIPHASVMMFF